MHLFCATSWGVGYVDLPFTTQISVYIHCQDEHEHPIDEGQVRDAHDRAYNKGSGSNLSANSLGSAAALQVGYPSVTCACIFMHSLPLITDLQAAYQRWKGKR